MQLGPVHNRASGSRSRAELTHVQIWCWKVIGILRLMVAFAGAVQGPLVALSGLGIPVKHGQCYKRSGSEVRLPECRNRRKRPLVSSLENTSANIANSPPRGWNSYDSFIWVISEEEFLQSADIVSKRLKAQGYEYVVVDYLWYRRKVPGASTNSLGFDVIDEWGRMVPDPGRWPSSKDGKGFSEIAKKVHDMGLKFGIHIMKGISFQAVNENSPILDTKKGGPYEEGGRVWHAQDIAIKENPCKWMNQGFMSINTELEAGKAFLRSLHEQYAQWGVDFVKHDCIFGEDLDLGEITYVSGVLKEQDHPILYSLSPGVGATPDVANKVTGLVNMYRVTGDDWDNWKDVLGHFDVARDFADAKLAGASGLQGNSWPDLDMLPMGWLSKPAKSPLMFGGDVRKLDQATYDIITNPIVLEINSFSSNNKEFPYNGNLKGALRFAKPSYSSSLVLTSCHDSKAKGWSMETLDEHIEQICWKGNNKQTPFCVSKTVPHLTEQEKKIQEHNRKLYEQKHHLVATDGAEDCLDAAPKRKRITTELKKDSFSPCRLDKNQSKPIPVEFVLGLQLEGMVR
ncbi:Alpha-galactosidase [Quillaja saponaria]|uniref:Alpha-galactosidase n=1 Tax=Quillaja saponaria TaxID=32244 RepID=A0AAD7KY34_QUISA|nr:Alpha-galactosidase [Quillaja saponaria]